MIIFRNILKNQISTGNFFGFKLFPKPSVILKSFPKAAHDKKILQFFIPGIQKGWVEQTTNKRRVYYEDG